MLKTTLNFLIKDNQILLAMKKRGFGQGKWNGVGGKVRVGEAVADAAIRETTEEIGVKIKPANLQQMATLSFYFADKPDWNQQCNVFITKSWQGEPTESEEMQPMWFNLDQIPYHQMWIDDKYWLPLVLAGEKLKAEFYFNNDGSELKSYQVTVILF